MEETMTTSNGSDPRAVMADLFEHQVRADPDAVAIHHDGKDLSRGELDVWSDAIAAELRDAGVRDGDLVGLAVERGPVAVASILALIKVGAGYLALEAEVPARRQRALFEATAPVAMLVQDHLDRLITVSVPTVWADPVGGTARRKPDPPAYGDGSRVFQVATTSGTTGAPKAVRIGYGAVLNRLRWMWDDHPFPVNAAVLVHKPYGLVAAPWEMLGGLLQGVRPVSLRQDELLDPVLLAGAILGEQVTHLYLTPQLIEGLIRELERRDADAPSIRLVTSGADALPVSLVHQFRRRLPHAVLLNLYGATETSSNTAAFDTAQLPDGATTVPVGRPVAGAQISVRDRNLRLVPLGVKGEVCVAGAPLALGYVGDAQDEQDRFVRMPDGSVLHRTGDLGRWNSDRQLEILGRLDNQVKVRGHRVVLEGVESAITEVRHVTSAGVHAITRDGGTSLIACITGTSALDTATLRAQLRDRLPEHMIPSRFHLVGALPMTPTGKLDRGRLAELAVSISTETRIPELTPQGPIETALAAAWTEALGQGPVTTEEDFFDAGGHSMLAVKLIARLEQLADVSLPLREMLENPTFGGVAAALSRQADA
jgi:amino acid adenylation domain-containing protein